MADISTRIDGDVVDDRVREVGDTTVGTVDKERLLEIDTTTPDDAHDRLREIATVYRTRSREIAETLSAETDYPISDAEALVEVATSFLVNVEDQYDDVFGSGYSTRFDRDVAYDREIRVERKPKGNVLVITPGNATVPIAILATASALATGNSVTVRPSMSACKSAYAALKPFLTRFPDSVNLVFCDAETAVDSDVLERFDALHYTGSSRHYASIEEAAAEAKIDSYIEGEGCGLFVVESYPEVAARAFADAITRCNGSLCTTPSGILVSEAVEDEFTTELRKSLSSVVAGPPDERGTDIAADAVASSEDLRPRMEFDNPVEIVERDAAVENLELYGPAAWLDTWSSTDEVVEFLRERDHGLNVTLFTADAQEMLDADEALSSRVCVNADPTLQSPHSPWGAMDESGSSPGTTLMEKFSRRVIYVEDSVDDGRTSEALVLKRPGELEFESYPVNGSDGLVVENRWSGVCGTDKAMYAGDLEAATPVVPGHENVSRVLSGTGEDVRGEPVSEGDYVLWCGVNPCGDCATCEAGAPNNCIRRTVSGVSKTATLSPHVFGGWATTSFVEAGTFMLKLSDEQARDPVHVLAEPLATAVGTPIDGDVLVVGDGSMGSLYAAYASEAVGANVSVVGRPRRADRLDPFVDEFIARGDEVPRSAFDTVVNGTGVASVFERAFEYVRPTGTIIETSILEPADARIDPSKIVNQSIDVHGKLAYDATDLEDAFEFVAAHAEPLSEFVETYSIREYESALDAEIKGVFDLGEWEPS